MIRQANKYDKTAIIEMMKAFRNESPIPQYQVLDNPDYWNRLLDTILAGKGIIFIEENVGLIMGITVPCIWDDTKFTLHELAWYVKPDKRHSTTGYRLLKSYTEYGKKMKDEGRIIMFTIAKMISSPDIKYDKFGFSKLDESWVQ